MKLAEALALAPRSRTARRHEEDDLQVGIVDWLRLVLDAKLYRVFHVPNGGARDAREAARLKKAGVLAGVFDIGILGSSGRIWWLEVKTEDGDLSDAQQGFRAFLIATGCPHAVVRSIAEVERVVADWGLTTRVARQANRVPA